MKPGKIRQKLSLLLEEKGVIINPLDLWSQKGYYTHRNHDLARWGGHAHYNGHLAILCSWDTMTDCVKYGIEISVKGNEIEVSYAEKIDADHDR